MSKQLASILIFCWLLGHINSQAVPAQISTVEPNYTDELQNEDELELEQLEEDLYENLTDADYNDNNVNFPERAAGPVELNKLHDGILCRRTCRRGVKRICHFTFVLEHYQTMGVACGNCAYGNSSACNNPQCVVGDGYEKGVMSINRQIPGPALQVCQGDLIIVDIENESAGTAAAIHWHGMHMLATPHMDGVPFVTQCPITYANKFRYAFEATEAGTHFYHSHAGHHKLNGHYGALIVRQPRLADPMRREYNRDEPEHYVLISDWTHEYAEQLFPGLRSKRPTADAVLINGRGSFIDAQTRYRENRVPPTIYYVERLRYHRFRIINAGSHACAFRVRVEQHSLRVIASDGYNVQPRDYDALVINSGERYDVVIRANNTRGDYWLRVTGMGACEARPVDSLALLRYGRPTGSEEQLSLPEQPHFMDNPLTGNVLNDVSSGCWPGDNCAHEMVNMERDDGLLTAIPDRTIFLAFNNYVVPNEEIFNSGNYTHFINIRDSITVVGAMNNLSLTTPPTPPLTQPDEIDESLFCEAGQTPARCEGRRLCNCVHRVKVPLNAIVKLIIVDESQNIGPIQHPFHLHGYRFSVEAMGQHPQGIPMTVTLARAMESRKLLVPSSTFRLSNTAPPFKDTVSIPSRGFAVVRFRASNPGFWLLHCHYEWHLSIGMGLIVQVGELNEMVSPPPNFPKCGNYQPPVVWP